LDRGKVFLHVFGKPIRAFGWNNPAERAAERSVFTPDEHV